MSFKKLVLLLLFFVTQVNCMDFSSDLTVNNGVRNFTSNQKYASVKRLFALWCITLIMLRQILFIDAKDQCDTRELNFANQEKCFEHEFAFLKDLLEWRESCEKSSNYIEAKQVTEDKEQIGNMTYKMREFFGDEIRRCSEMDHLIQHEVALLRGEYKESNKYFDPIKFMEHYCQGLYEYRQAESSYAWPCYQHIVPLIEHVLLHSLGVVLCLSGLAYYVKALENNCISKYHMFHESSRLSYAVNRSNEIILDIEKVDPKYSYKTMAVLIVCGISAVYYIYLKRAAREAHSKFKRMIKNGVIDNKEECNICLENNNESSVTLVCDFGHQFHEVCIKRWFMQKINCPICHQRF